MFIELGHVVDQATRSTNESEPTTQHMFTIQRTKRKATKL